MKKRPKSKRVKPQGFRRALDKGTICETLRMVNDLCQTDSEDDVRSRTLLFTAMTYAKKMNAKLTKYKHDYDKGWWQKLPKEEQDRHNKLRQDAGYKCLE